MDLQSINNHVIHVVRTNIFDRHANTGILFATSANEQVIWKKYVDEKKKINLQPNTSPPFSRWMVFIEQNDHQQSHRLRQLSHYK
jgi:hypothetical protein